MHVVLGTVRPQKCQSALWSLRKVWSNLSRAVAHCNESSGYLCWHSPDALQAALVRGAPFVDFPKLGKLVLNFMIPWCQCPVNLWASRRSLLLGCSCGPLCAGRRWVMELTGSKLIQQEETRGENWFLSITVSQSGSCRGCVGLMLAWRKEPTFTPATCTATSLNLMQTCSVAKTQQMNFGIFFSVTAERLLIYPHIMTSSLIRRKVSNETMCTKWTASYRSKLTGEFFHECSLCDISIV